MSKGQSEYSTSLTNKSPIEEISEALSIPIIDSERNYWLIRTSSGLYFEDFRFNDFIGIGWNKVDEDFILKLPEINVQNLKEGIIPLYPQEKRHGLVAGYVYKFLQDIKKGDIVLIPDKNSRYIAFGEVIDDKVYFENLQDAVEKEEKALSIADKDEDCLIQDSDLFISVDDDEFNLCPYIKRRDVRWLHTLHKSQLDSKLLPALNSHNTISNINKYAPLIDRTLNHFFIKNNEVHLLLNVSKQTEITFGDYINFTSGLDSLIKEFNETNPDYTSNITDMEMKINVESPGIMELISKLNPTPAFKTISPVLIIGMALISILGGKISFATFTFETQGLPNLISKLSDFVNKANEKKLNSSKDVEKAIVSLNIKKRQTKK